MSSRRDETQTDQVDVSRRAAFQHVIDSLRGDDARVAQATGGVPVWRSIGGCLVLFKSGEVVWCDWDGQDVAPEGRPQHVRLAHFEAARQYAPLRHLAPVRSHVAASCSSCGGSGSAVDQLVRDGTISQEEGEKIVLRAISCGTCLGLGWTEPDDPS